eukprot:gene13441-14824_t
MAGDWQRLVTGERSAKSIALSMVVHRVTGSKEAVKFWHHTGAGISRIDVIKQNKKFASDVQKCGTKASSLIPKGKPTHVTVDNSDGSFLDHESPPRNIPEKQQWLPAQEIHYGSYNIGKKLPHPIVNEYSDHKSRYELNQRMTKDCVWALAASLQSSEENAVLPPLGSWTAFNAMTTSSEKFPSTMDFLPVIPAEPSYTIFKYYLDFLVTLTKDLEIDHIYSHSDQDAQDSYKRYGAMGLRDWWTQFGVIADESVDQAIEGRHYVKGLLEARDKGEELLQNFIKDRILSHNVGFYDPVKRSGIMTGMEKNKKVPKATSVFKEDQQAPGLLVSKCPDKKDAISYPLTTYPLAIATPEGMLNKPNTKHLCRNYLVEIPPPLPYWNQKRKLPLSKRVGEKKKLIRETKLTIYESPTDVNIEEEIISDNQHHEFTSEFSATAMKPFESTTSLMNNETSTTAVNVNEPEQMKLCAHY